MRKYIGIILIGLLLININCIDTNASKRAIKTSEVFECNGKLYGYHEDHYHEVIKKNNTYYPSGDKIELDNSCLIKKEQLEKEEVTLVSCVDGDTAKFKVDDKTYTTRFLAIDTREVKHPTKKKEYYGKEASNYTCTNLKNASIIELEYDKNSDKFDKYNRLLAWVFVDNKLLQEKIVENGYGEVAYLYGDYKYTANLEAKQEIAKQQKVGIWDIETENKKSDNILDKIVMFSKELFNKMLTFMKNLL